MPRKKVYAKTIAFRVTEEEWEAIEHIMDTQPLLATPTAVVRAMIGSNLLQAVESKLAGR